MAWLLNGSRITFLSSGAQRVEWHMSRLSHAAMTLVSMAAIEGGLDLRLH